MRKSKNTWKFVSVEIMLADSMESHFCKISGEPTSGKYIRIGFGSSPKKAYRNAKVRSEGNTNLSTILYGTVYFLNGKEQIRYGDNLINSDGTF